MTTKVDSKRILNNLDTLATFDTEPDRPGTTRLWLEDSELAARSFVKELMTEAGMEIHEDDAANIYGILPGTDRNLPPVWSGSHVDTVVCGGKYDGLLGTVGAIEACRTIHAAGLAHKRDIVALVYSSEEPVRFGVGCVGSRALAGHLTMEEMHTLKDDGGKTMYELLTERGYHPDNIPSLKIEKGAIHASVELHIEQSAKLEENHLPIGIVTGICAPTYMHVTVKGVQEHAGSTPMTIRKDALCAAAEIILALENFAQSYGHPNAVGTVGKLNVTPNASNVIPGRVDFSIDVRDFLYERKDELIARISAFMDEVAKKRGVTIEYKVLGNDVPSISDPSITACIENACQELGIPYMEMVSGAYHDSMFIAQFAPVGMIFVPSVNGVSHDPSEYTEPEDLVRGVQVLTETLLALSNQ